MIFVKFRFVHGRSEFMSRLLSVPHAFNFKMSQIRGGTKGRSFFFIASDIKLVSKRRIFSHKTYQLVKNRLKWELRANNCKVHKCQVRCQVRCQICEESEQNISQHE